MIQFRQTVATPTSGHADLDRVLNEISERLMRGEEVDVEAYAAQVPAHADHLRGALPGIQALVELGHAPSERGDSAPAHLGVLGDFQIIRELGRGGMGVVYEAEQISLRRKVALKVLPFAGMLDARQLARFQNEARAAATLYHPNIVPVFFVGSERSVHFYAMQLIEGASLAEVIQEMRSNECRVTNEERQSANPSLTTHHSSLSSNSSLETSPIAALSTEHSQNPRRYFETVARLGIQAASALDHAHEHGIVHRDIKPANLLLDADAKLLVTDFGLARIESDKSMTMSGDLLGTLRYMSPEQALGKRGVDHRTDIYSLGITLYELATLHSAFEGTDRQELLHQIAFEEPKPPRSIVPNMSRDVETILLKAIAKDPAARYATAAEMADDLNRFTEQRPITARRQSRLSKTVQWARRNRSIAALGSLALLLLATLAIGGPIVAVRQKALTKLANDEAEYSNRLRYFSDMRLAYEAWQRHDYRQALSLLKDHKQSNLRHFEWHFLWNHLHLHEELNSLPHKETISIFALSNNRSKLVTSCLDDRFYVWDLVTRKLITSDLRPERDPGSWVASMAVSNGGEMVLLGMENGLIDVVSTSSGQRIAEFTKHEATCFGLALTSGGDRAVSGDNDGKLYLWDIATGELEREFQGHSGTVRNIRFARNGRTFATSGGDRSVKLWSLDQEAPLQLMKGPHYSINTLAFGSDTGALFAGTGGRRSLWKWNLGTGKGGPLVSQLLGTTDIFGLAYSPMLKLLAINGGKQGITILDPETAVPERDILALPIFGTAEQVAFAHDDTTVAYADDREIKLLDLSYLERQPGPEVELIDWWTSLEYVPSREELIACRIPNLHNDGVGEGSVVALDVGKGYAKKIHGKDRVAAWEIRASPEGDVYAIARGSYDYDDLHGKVTLHDAETGKLLRAFDDGDSSYISVAFSPNGRLLAAGSGFNDGAVVVWDRASGDVAGRFDVPTPWCLFKAVEFSADSRYLIAGGGLWERGEVYCWDIDSGETVHHLSDVGEVALEISLSPDCSEFAVATFDGSIRIYEWPQFTQRLVLDTASDGFAVAYSPDGARLATGGKQRGVRLWDVKTGRQVAFFATDDRVMEVAFTQGGRALAAGVSGKTHVWNIDGTRKWLNE